MPETVLTSRRAALVTAGRPVPGRLRLSDRSVRFTPADGSAPVDVPLPAVRRVVRRRGVLLIDAPGARLRLRCFGLPGVAGLLLQARSAAAPPRP